MYSIRQINQGYRRNVWMQWAMAAGTKRQIMSALRDIKYMRIASEIEEEIREKKMEVGAPVYSVHAIMSKWGVSMRTANHTLELLTNRKIICRIQGKGCFVCKKAIKRRAREYRVAYTISKFDDFKLEQLIGVPEMKLIRLLKDNHCLLTRLDKHIYKNDKVCHAELKKMDGVLISATIVNILQFPHLHDLKIPAVLVHGDIITDMPFHQVLPDPMPGLREMFGKAKPFGFKGVIIVRHEHTNGKKRADSCRQAAEESGYGDIREFVFHSSQNAYSKAKEVIPFLPDYLVFACSCLIAFPFMNAFDDSGLGPSVDYHMVCYDEIESIGVHPKPAEVMTTIGYSHEITYKTAAEILLSEMKHPSGLIKKILVPTSLTIRQSGLNGCISRF